MGLLFDLNFKIYSTLSLLPDLLFNNLYYDRLFREECKGVVGRRESQAESNIPDEIGRWSLALGEMD